MNIYEGLGDKKVINRILLEGVVVENSDPFRNQTLKVRIPELDAAINDKDLPPCYYLGEFMIYAQPRIGERVMVILDVYLEANKKTNQSKRYWLAKTISRIENMSFDPKYYSANSHEIDGYLRQDKPITANASARGLYPNLDDVAFYGRHNTEMVHSENYAILRAGRSRDVDTNVFNNKDSAYFLVKYGTSDALKDVKQTVEQVEELPTLHTILLITIDNKATIRVLDGNGNIVDSFSNTYVSRQELQGDIPAQLDILKRKYPFWHFTTQDTFFAYLPSDFDGKRQVVKREISFKQSLGVNSFAAMVADVLLLIGRRNSEYPFLDKPNELIDINTFAGIMENAQSMIKGENLIRFLDIVRLALLNHIHPYNGLPVNKDTLINQLANFDLQTLLNPNIKTV